MIRNKKLKKCISVLALSVLTAFVPAAGVLAADGSSYVYDGYIFDYYRNALPSPAAFTLERVIDTSSMPGFPIQSADDVCTSKDGRIFITDKKSSRINVFDEDGNYIVSLKTIKKDDGTIVLDEEGKQMVLNAPEGCYVHEKTNELYIADTGAGRILILDLDTYAFKREILEPDNITGSTMFKPSKIAVDEADRIFVVVQSSYEGIIELTNEGSFIGYYGVNVPQVNYIEYFWKSLATDAQKEKMRKSFAPAFNNVAVDGEGFVMAVTYDAAASDMIFRLNSKGENVINEEGNTFLIGDIIKNGNEISSQFTDIAVTDYGTYAVVDQARGRIFIYDFDGMMLNAFGSLGNIKGQFKAPTGIAWLGQKLVVTDSSLACAYILAPTEFGSAMLSGSEHYYNGDWDGALEYFNKSVALNSNYDVGYVGIGKNYLMKDDYENAMKCFKLGSNRLYYSKAYYGYRGEQLKKHFAIVAIVMVALIGLLIWSEIRYNLKNKKKG